MKDDNGEGICRIKRHENARLRAARASRAF